MPFITCRKADGRIVSASRWDAQPFDDATQVQFTLPDMPLDPITLRWDGAEGLRPETVQEATSRTDVTNGNTLDGSPLCAAVVRWVAQKLGVSPAVARNEILTIYKSLQN